MVAANPQKLMGSAKTVQTAVVQPQQQLIAAPADTAALQDISKSLARITQLLTAQNLQVTAEANQERKNQENARRKKVELGLENSFASVKNVAQSVIAPVKNILDSIIQFFVTLFLGKAILNLIDWFSKKENQGKIRSIARFLKDWWPSLVAGYILFGTGFGRVVRNLAGIGLRVVIGLGGLTLKLGAAIASAIGFKKAGAAMSALGGGGGLKGIAARLLLGGAIAGGTALVANKMMGGGDAPQVSVPEPATLPTAEAFGGGLIDFKTMLAASGGQVDSKLGIFAQLFGSGGFAGLLNSVPGVVSGPKGIDKVPAMLTDGEFVMSRGAVQKFGVSNLEAMNASGGGTNKPKIVQKRIHAYGGGFIGDDARIKYDAEKGAGAYDRESARRRALANATPNEKANLPPLKTGSEYHKNNPLTARPTSTPSISGMSTLPQIDIKKISNSAASSAQGLVKSVSASTGIGSGKLTPEQQRRIAKDDAERKKIIQKGQQRRDAEKNVRSEYLKILKDQSHPLYDQAAFGDLTLDKFKQQHQAAPATVGPRFADLRGSATPGSSIPASGAKGKYYSSADQKTYASENDAKAARKSRMTSLASQQGLDKLSRKGASRSSQGVRFDAESKERNKDFEKRGGFGGQIGRGFTRMFGGGDQISKLDQQDKTATTKVKQAGASSIGRYYSSSDGKYYKDYNAASKARKARLATTPVKGKPITPTPKPAPKVYNPGGGAMGGGRGSGGGSKGTRIPSIPTGKDNRKTANQLNIK